MFSEELQSIAAAPQMSSSQEEHSASEAPQLFLYDMCFMRPGDTLHTVELPPMGHWKWKPLPPQQARKMMEGEYGVLFLRHGSIMGTGYCPYKFVEQYGSLFRFTRGNMEDVYVKGSLPGTLATMLHYMFLKISLNRV